MSLFALLAGAYLLASDAQCANRKPIADAGDDLTTGLGVAVTLSGARSSDPDGAPVRYRWRQTAGSRVRLSGGDSPSASLVTPASLKRFRKAEALKFALTVFDQKRARSTDTVVVSVQVRPLCLGGTVLIDGICSAPPVCVPPQVLNGSVCFTPPPRCRPPVVLRNGVCFDPTPQCAEGQILQQGVCVTPPPVCVLPEQLQNGVCAVPGVVRWLNDTGVTSCSDAAVNGFACPFDSIPGQDAEFGRDVIAADASDGRAGFSFTKIGSEGQELPEGADQWDCVRDNVTGLMWELKSNDGGLRDRHKRYSNYSTSYDPAGQYGSDTDATGLLRAVNGAGLCGSVDWRLPDATELQGLINYGVGYPGPAVDAGYFPDTETVPYWTATPYAKRPEGAWVVYFDDGRVFDAYRSDTHPVRLVRTVNAPESGQGQ